MNMNTIAVRINRKVREAEGVFSFELVSADGAPLPSFAPGAHIDVHVGDFIRQYSLCNVAAENHRYVIGVLRDQKSRGGSSAMHDHVKQGDLIQIGAPRNHFPLAPARRTLLFAGGIGVTPILCMAEQLALAGADFEMHYCSRSVERTAFVERIRSSAYAGSVHFHFDTGPQEQQLNAAQILAVPAPDTHLHVCGPAGFMDHVINTAQALHWSREQIHFEYFAANASDTVGDTAFEVQIASSGKNYTIPIDCTVVQALALHGIEIPVSCEQGVCGTCITRVLDGAPDHRDVYFTDEERASNDQFTPCCSRSKSRRLVLDL